MESWRKRLSASTRALIAPDAPVWWDGFSDVILHGHSASVDDNPYLNDGHEGRDHRQYRAGARAAVSLLRNLPAPEC
jgi:hypothetical protein